MISKEEIQKLAELSRIELHEGEVEALQKDISSILDYVGQVSTAEDTTEKEVSLNRNIMRDDIPYAEGNQLLGSRDALVGAFPEKKNDYNVVRKIIQKDE
jgi:aspartyl/glutamyl-tRNA(Asn/Gln) amidotransferase C subunit